MRVIYVGYCVSESEAMSNRAVSAPGNEASMRLIDSLSERYKNEFKVITITPNATFPNGKRIICKYRKIKILKDITSTAIGYINIFGFKQITIMVNLFNELLKEIKNCDEGRAVKIIVVNSDSITAIPIMIAKCIKNVKCICYMPDMPFSAIKMKGIKGVMQSIDDRFRKLFLTKFDSVIAYVKKATNAFVPAECKVIIIDHTFKEEQYSKYKKEKEKSRERAREVNMLYIGSLNENYSIEELLKVMEYLPNNYKLFIYGKGQLQKKVEENSKLNNNLIYGGFISSDKAIELQCSADVLISLLRVDREIGKYAIPSKIVGYLASGTPIISTKVLSIPEKYSEFINFLEKDDAQSIAKKIIEITELEAYEDAMYKADKAKEFMLTKCNWKNQMDKIFNLIEET